MSDFEDIHPQWMRRKESCRYFGIPDDDSGWDVLNEIVLDYDIDAEMGENGDVIRINANDENVKEALFDRHARRQGHRPDDPEKVAEARREIAAVAEREKQQRTTVREANLKRRIEQRRKQPAQLRRRIEGG